MVYDMDDTEKLAAEIRTSDILSNATRVGMHPLENISIITDHSLFREELVVTDVSMSQKKQSFYRMPKRQAAKQSAVWGCSSIRAQRQQSCIPAWICLWQRSRKNFSKNKMLQK